jgi:predicted porin
MLNATAAVTAGTVSNPLFSDDNHGRQIAGRVELRPIAGLILGTSVARGPFVSDAAARAAVGEGHDGDFTQTAWGGDAEYSRDYYLLRFETTVSRWRMPAPPPPSDQLALLSPLDAASISIEGRYKLRPDFYVAARYDHLGFSDLPGTLATLPWDAPVTRVEIGGGYSLQRNLLVKFSYQHDNRDGGNFLPRVAHLLAGQLVYWF